MLSELLREVIGLDLGLEVPERGIRVVRLGDVTGVPGVGGETAFPYTGIVAERLEKHGEGPFLMLAARVSLYTTSANAGNRLPAWNLQAPTGILFSARVGGAIAASTNTPIDWWHAPITGSGAMGSLPSYLPIPRGSIISLVQTGFVDQTDIAQGIQATFLDLGSLRVAREQVVSRMLQRLEQAGRQAAAPVAPEKAGGGPNFP